MAREFASVRLSIWDDVGFRALSPRAQHLYFVLMTSATLSFCGVADWRPNRIAALAAGWSSAAVEQAAAELSAGRHIVIDEGTEEVLLRAFVRTDGLMKQPNMAVAMAVAHRAVASGDLRAVILEEVYRLSVEQPELACWGAKASKDVMSRLLEQHSEVAGKGQSEPANPSGKGSRNPSGKGSQAGAGRVRVGVPEGDRNPSGNPSPTTATATATDSSTTASPAETALFDAPPEPPGARETEGQRMNRLSRIYTDKVKLTAFHAVAGCVKAALRAEIDGVREYSDTQIADGLRLLAEERRTVTANSLRTAMEGLPPPPSQTRRSDDARPGSGVWGRVANTDTEGRTA